MRLKQPYRQVISSSSVVPIMPGPTDRVSPAAWHSFLSMDSLKTIFVNLQSISMRVLPVLPENMNDETRYVHDEIAKQVARAQGPVPMLNADGALIGPFPPMLHFSQFGIPALSFIRSLDAYAKL